MRATLNGYVVSDDDLWLYHFFGFSAFSPKDVRDALRDNPEGEELVLEINSPGGSVFAGFEMYSALRAARNVRTVAEVQSLAASAASTMMLGCGRVMLSPVAQVMIHLPSTITDGDVPAHRDSIRVLDSITESILNAYELRCRGKRTRDELERMMERSAWMPAQDALAAGLADGILYADGEAQLLPQNIVNAVGGGIRALAGAGALPDVGDLRARYAQLVAEGKAPAREQDETGGPPRALAPTGAAEDAAGGKPPANMSAWTRWRDEARLRLARARR